MKPSDRPLFVTKTFLPPIEEYISHVRDIWESGKITNIGEKNRLLQKELAAFLGVKHILPVTNGTLALQLSIKALGLKGEILTTPFSYVATLNSIIWEGCTPVFVDIDEETCCISAEHIEASITENTVAILPVHVYGNACDVVKIDALGKKYGLAVIYDAAHTFGVDLNGQSLLSYGDISTLSFHATKLFHTIEGGAIVTNNTELFEKLTWMHTFGHQGDTYFGLGTNAKLSEFSAAMGLCVLPNVPDLIAYRKWAHSVYDDLLFPHHSLRKPIFDESATRNYSYYPLIFETEQQTLEMLSRLKEYEIAPRRYFWPSLSKLPQVEYQSCPVAEALCERVVCLPLSHEISEADITLICSVIKEVCS